jgi:hypothetical protein
MRLLSSQQHNKRKKTQKLNLKTRRKKTTPMKTRRYSNEGNNDIVRYAHTRNTKNEAKSHSPANRHNQQGIIFVVIAAREFRENVYKQSSQQEATSTPKSV